MSKLEGGCLCGKVRYSGETNVLKTAVCNCTYCQKQTSSAFSISLAIVKDSIQFNGDLSCYDSKGGSGNIIHSYFCPNCGTVVYNKPDAMPNLHIIKAGTLDDVSWVKPTLAVYCSGAQSWVNFDETIQQYAEAME